MKHERPSGVPEPGEILAGKYRVERVLGAGGMGVVVAAQHIELGQTVAVKLMLASAGTTAVAVERFLREARAAARIQGDHVVRVFDVGKLDSGAPYMVMELLRGSDLGEVLRERGPLPVADVVDYVLQACDAIAQAHAMGIVHRDLKPSNLFLAARSDGSPLVKVLDFGISKAASQDASTPNAPALTATNSVMGSPMYMSPEQVRNAKSVDARSDIWALGIIIHELLAGAPAFQAETLPGICAAIIADEPAPLRELRPGIPEGLAAVVERCLQKDASRRYLDVAALAEALVPFAVRATVPTSMRRASGTSHSTGDKPSPIVAPATSASKPGGGTRSVAFQSTMPPPLHPEVSVSSVAPDPLAASAAALSRSAPGSTTAAAQPAVTRARVVGGFALAGAVVIGAGAYTILRPAPTPPAAAVSAPIAAAPSAGERRTFTVFIDSLPGGAEVKEGGRVLGTTPMQLTIDNAQVKLGARTLVIERAGYQPYSIVQGPSEESVRVVAPLTPSADSGPAVPAAAPPAGAPRTGSTPASPQRATGAPAPVPQPTPAPVPAPTTPPAPGGKDIVLER